MKKADMCSTHLDFQIYKNTQRIEEEYKKNVEI